MYRNQLYNFFGVDSTFLEYELFKNKLLRDPVVNVEWYFFIPFGVDGEIINGADEIAVKLLHSTWVLFLFVFTLPNCVKHLVPWKSPVWDNERRGDLTGGPCLARRKEILSWRFGGWAPVT